MPKRPKVYLFDHSPHLRGEWDYEKNLQIDAETLGYGSNIKVWWLCPKSTHSFLSSPKNKTKGWGCPYCSGRKVLAGFNDLQTTHPTLSQQLSPDSLDPTTVSFGSSKKAVWLCQYGHNWSAAISDRVRRGSCPRCSGQSKTPDTERSLITLYPEVAENLLDKDLGTDLYPNSHRKVEWVCESGHIYSATVANKVKGSGCPYCSGRKVLAGRNDIETTHPHLVDEWDYGLNEVDPCEVSYGSRTKRWWRCYLDHSWAATPNARTAGLAGCPVCFNKTSKIEGVLREMIGERFDLESIDHTHRLPIPWKKWKSMQVDVHMVVGEAEVVIEYDGAYWHKDKYEIDYSKTKVLLDAGYLVVRIREQTHQYVLPHIEIIDDNLFQVSVEYQRKNDNLTQAVGQIIEWLETKNG